MIHWKKLALETNEELARRDLAEIHLACAEGLPGWDRIDHVYCLRWLDGAARVVQRYTDNCLPDFRKNPQDYENSEPYFRALCLITVLERDLGIRYNPEKTSEEAPFTIDEIFIHGAITGKGGTCASMPVIHAAVGRRLGYPIKLVQAPRHLFCRWDEPGRARFNIDASGKGMHSRPDDFYLQGRYQSTPGQLRESTFLKSQTPSEELSGFIGQAAYLWFEVGKLKEAADRFIWASCLSPEHKLNAIMATGTLDRWDAEICASLPPNFPRVRVNMPLRRRYSDYIPKSVEHRFIGNDGRERLLQDPQFLEQVLIPLTANPNWRPPHIPEQIVVNMVS